MRLIGLTIVEVRAMTAREIATEGWQGLGPAPAVVVLSNGSLIYAATNGDGDGPGVLFCYDTAEAQVGRITTKGTRKF